MKGKDPTHAGDINNLPVGIHLSAENIITLTARELAVIIPQEPGINGPRQPGLVCAVS